MSGQDDDSDKSFEATPQKLLEARKKGEVAKSTDLLTAAGYLGLLVALWVAGESGVRQAGTTLMVLIGQSADIAPLFFGGNATAVAGPLMKAITWGLVPILVIPAFAVILSLLAQQGLVFAPSKLEPKLSRISVISNAKNKFGRGGLFEFFKSFVKLCVYSLCLTFFVRAHMDEIASVLQTSPQLVVKLLSELFLSFLFVVVIISGTIGGVDALWQRAEHLRKNRMTRKEIMDETKNSEGDPHMKQERRQRAMAISQSQMMKDVPTADVIIVNPTHYAVALKWSRLPGEAPVCVAKGVDEIALVIRKLATDANVPIHSDPPTARALHATTEIGHQIAPEHFRAVAAAIRFAEAMRTKAKGRI